MLQKPIPEPKVTTRTAILIEVVMFIILALVSKSVVSQFTWSFAGPISLVMTLAILTLFLRSKGVFWSDMGFRALPGMKAKLMVIPQAMLVFLAFAAVVASVLIIGPAMGLEFLAEVPAGVDDRWGDVKGNLPKYLLWLGIVWTSAAFGEEMFFRGYLITRLQTAFSDVRFGTVLAVALPALLFGCCHVYYQGLRGLVVTGAIGLVFGTMFLLFKRNLWPIVLWHGIVDTMAFTAIFMDWDL